MNHELQSNRRSADVQRSAPAWGGDALIERSATLGKGDVLSCVEVARFCLPERTEGIVRPVAGHLRDTPDSNAIDRTATSNPRPDVDLEETRLTLWQLKVQLRSLVRESTQALVAAVEAKDPFTFRHSTTVAEIATALGRKVGLSARQLAVLQQAAMLHDVGKIGVPDAILTKPGPLTDEEFEVVKRHPGMALAILGHLSSLRSEIPLILHHHERYDGDGYPSGLSGDRIPFGARILAVADASEAMISRRSYKDSYPARRVVEELRREAGGQFDPGMAHLAADLFESGELPPRRKSCEWPGA